MCLIVGCIGEKNLQIFRIADFHKLRGFHGFLTLTFQEAFNWQNGLLCAFDVIREIR